MHISSGVLGFVPCLLYFRTHTEKVVLIDTRDFTRQGNILQPVLMCPRASAQRKHNQVSHKWCRDKPYRVEGKVLSLHLSALLMSRIQLILIHSNLSFFFFFKWILLLVSLPNARSQRFFSLFLVKVLTFKSYTSVCETYSVNFYVWYEVRI